MHTFLDERDKATIDEQLNNLETNVNELSKDLDELTTLNKIKINSISSNLENIRSIIFDDNYPTQGWIDTIVSPIPLLKDSIVQFEFLIEGSFIINFRKQGSDTNYQTTEHYGFNEPIVLLDNYDSIAIYSAENKTGNQKITLIVNYVKKPIDFYGFYYFNHLEKNGIWPYVQTNIDLNAGDTICVNIIKNASTKFQKYILYYAKEENSSTDFDMENAEYFYETQREFRVPSNYKCVRLVCNTIEDEGVFDFSAFIYKKKNETSNILLSNAIPNKKTFSVIGDSWSSFKKYINPTTNRAFYPEWEPDTDSHGNGNDVVKASQMWWYKLEKFNNMQMVQNNSYSGSPICFTNNAKKISFATRVLDMIPADIIFIVGGTNDQNFNADIGEAVYERWTDLDLTKFKPAVCFIIDYLKTRFPHSKIVFLIPPDLNSNYKDAIIETCRHYSVIYEIMWGMTYIGYHPDAESQEKIARIAYVACMK